MKWILKLPVKLIALPVILFLTILVGVLMIVLNITATLLNIGSGIMGVVGVALIFTGQYVGAALYLTIAFLISPYGLPSVAAAILGFVDYINYSLKSFVMS